jgi:hypothetical protein
MEHLSFTQDYCTVTSVNVIFHILRFFSQYQTSLRILVVQCHNCNNKGYTPAITFEHRVVVVAAILVFCNIYSNQGPALAGCWQYSLVVGCVVWENHQDLWFRISLEWPLASATAPEKG